MDGGGVITVDSDAIDGRRRGRRGRRGRRWALASPIVGGFCSCVETLVVFFSRSFRYQLFGGLRGFMISTWEIHIIKKCIFIDFLLTYKNYFMITTTFPNLPSFS